MTLTHSVTTGADLDGSLLPSATTGYQYDRFGNVTQITVTSFDGFSKVTTNAQLSAVYEASTQVSGFNVAQTAP